MNIAQTICDLAKQYNIRVIEGRYNNDSDQHVHYHYVSPEGDIFEFNGTWYDEEQAGALLNWLEDHKIEVEETEPEDRLLGEPPNQITESEKAAKLEEIREKIINLPTGPGTAKEWSEEYCRLTAEQTNLDRNYPDLPPKEGPIVALGARKTLSACPCIWEAVTVEGEEVYARFRWGVLSVCVGDKDYFHKRLDYGNDEDYSVEHYERIYGDLEMAKKMHDNHQAMVKMSGGVFSYKGEISFEELKEATEGWVIWK